ncbi:MAG: hypothetical protein H5U40_09885 [Polyangiaceae bacterium]|nr:hypothetical protein [Polyangiaceae bacterium]
MHRAALIAGASIFLVFAVGCADDEREAPRSAAACAPDASGAPLTMAQVLEAGPYAVGETHVTLVDESRTTPASGDAPELPSRTLEVAIWYPASARGTGTSLASGGAFPLVVYSHGLSSFNSEGSKLAGHLASRGYVVMAPGFPLSRLGADGGPTVIDIANQPGDVSFVIDFALASSAEGDHLLEGAIDPERIAAVGLSLGGLTTLLATYHATLRDPRIDVAAAMAPPASFLGEAFYDTRIAPLLLLSGDIDAIVPHDPNAATAFERADPPVSLFTFVAGTHTGFASISSLFESKNNADEVGCNAISGVLGEGADAGPTFDFSEALGGADAGLVARVDAPVCQEPLPAGMKPSRQGKLEIAAISSFLDAYLHSDPEQRSRACHYNERVLPAEAADLRFERR